METKDVLASIDEDWATAVVAMKRIQAWNSTFKGDNCYETTALLKAEREFTAMTGCLKKFIESMEEIYGDQGEFAERNRKNVNP